METQRRKENRGEALEQTDQQSQQLPQPKKTYNDSYNVAKKIIDGLRIHQWLTNSWTDALHALRLTYEIKSS